LDPPLVLANAIATELQRVTNCHLGSLMLWRYGLPGFFVNRTVFFLFSIFPWQTRSNTFYVWWWDPKVIQGKADAFHLLDAYKVKFFGFFTYLTPDIHGVGMAW